MKKLFITLVSVLALSMAFSACKKDENTDSPNTNKESPTPQKANKSVKVTGIYLSTDGKSYSNLNNIQIPRLTGAQSAQVAIGANFVNDGPEGVTEDDVIVVRAYINDKVVGDDEVELPAVNIENGKLIPLWIWTITAADCEGLDAISVCVEVVRVNKTKINVKHTAKLKIQ